LAEAVIDALPRFLAREGVVAMGELGYDEQTPLEDKALRAQIELAKEFELPIMVHTPHRDKRPGTLRTMDVLKEQALTRRVVSSTTTTKRPFAKFATAGSGAHFRSIPTPR
jgi:predicted metal-dependent TIM-barrel fold hydrolase